MRHMPNRLVRVLALALGLFSEGCGNPSPIAFSDGAYVLFPNTALTLSSRKILTVTNVDDAEVTIDVVRIESDQPDPPFRLVALDAAAGPACGAGVSLAAGSGRCQLAVEFRPVAEGHAQARLSLGFHQGGHERGESGIDLSGLGVLDCSVAADLTAGRQHGVAEATAKNEAEADRARAEAAALTFEDGKKDGYSAGYRKGYDAGYQDPNGYPAGYARGHADGWTRGANDPQVCDQALRDGDRDGRVQGFLDGAADGYAAGHDQGRAEGEQAGYDDGWAQGQAECSGSLRAESDPAPDPKYVDACHRQGYQATLDVGLHDRTFEAEKWKNAAYRSGYDASYPAGLHDGTVKGESDGARAGYDKGSLDGYHEGAGANYADCYQRQQAASYDDAYAHGWADVQQGFPAGHADGYAEGYAVGHDAGYRDAYGYYCGG